MTVDSIVAETLDYAPDAVLMGHSGSPSGHPVASRIARAVRAAIPRAWIIYGGVFPTYHWADIMEQEPAVDFIVRGEGEETIVRLTNALEQKQPLEQVPGIVFRTGLPPGLRRPVGQPSFHTGPVRATRPAPVFANLDANRAGWELIK